jgi:hypothetical protein
MAFRKFLLSSISVHSLCARRKIKAVKTLCVITVLVLLASVQCISACTLAACSETQSSQTPPCHKHQPPVRHAPDHAKDCDHQKTADEVRSSLPDLHVFVMIQAPSALSVLLLPVSNVPVGPPLVPTLDPPLISSVLRI